MKRDDWVCDGCGRDDQQTGECWWSNGAKDEQGFHVVFCNDGCMWPDGVSGRLAMGARVDAILARKYRAAGLVWLPRRWVRGRGWVEAGPG